MEPLKKQILMTEAEKNYFFKALRNPKKPNSRLKKAAKRFKQKTLMIQNPEPLSE